MLQTYGWLLLAAIGLAALLGCRGGKPEPVAAVPIKPTAVALPATKPAAPTGSPEPAAVGAEAPASKEEQSEAPAPPGERPKPAERILLLAPRNPIIIEFWLTIDGRPHDEALPKLVEEVLKIGDTDGDGQTTWKEICACKRIKYGQYGNLPIDNEMGEKQIIDRYDIARDGIADRTELPRFLTRNAGAARPFSVRGTLDHRDINRRGAPTWQVLDADNDGVISAEERALAASRLSGRDNDDDEILVASDLNPRLQTGDPEMMRAERRRRGPDAAKLLGPHADWSAIQLALEQEYAGGRMLRPDSFPLTPDLFARLDKNQDGRIRREEFLTFNEIEPQVIIAANFGSNPEESQKSEVRDQKSDEPNQNEVRRAQPTLRLVRIDPRLGGSQNVIEQPGRLTLLVGDVRLTIYTNDTVASDDFSARAKQALEMFDQNKDGYLEASEVPESLQGQLGRFEAVDADEDGKAYPHEIEAFLAQQQAGLRAQIHARATDQDDALFSALDADHDDRLDSREIEGAAQRLAALDANGDGQLTPEELPEVLVIGLARGSLENADVTFAPPPVIARAPDGKAPRWFTAMDANADGVISRREFLGTAEQFQKLDGNADGLLELTEAIATTATPTSH